VIKTLHVLEYAHDPACRRTIRHLLSRGERRNSLARAVFHASAASCGGITRSGRKTSSTASAS
jgi:TnpA family transposase